MTVYKVINGSKKLLDDDLTSCQRISVVHRGAFEVNTTSDRPIESVHVLVVPANETNCDELLLLRLTSSNKCPTYKECERLTENGTSKNCGSCVSVEMILASTRSSALSSKAHPSVN